MVFFNFEHIAALKNINVRPLKLLKPPTVGGYGRPRSGTDVGAGVLVPEQTLLL